MKRGEVLAGKRLMLGVTGSIAAYKAVDILRMLTERGVEVRVSMTDHACKFVSPLTFETLSGMPVLIDEFDGRNRSAIGHIDITDELDAALIAPATANIIGKIAAGIADDALSSAIMATDCPLLIAPAMNDRMYRNPVLKKNIAALTSQGVRFIEPGTGNLACGVVGQGRLADPDRIVTELSSVFLPHDLEGKSVLVTAGPTREPIDAVRFISNPSTGKMGYAIAAAARERGANVLLITGPTQLTPPSRIKIISVATARDMRDAVLANIGSCDMVFMAAAVSDFKPINSSDRKIKKSDASSVLHLERTADILDEIGHSRGGDRVLVGFAAETDNLEAHALKKLKDKNLDMIVVNDVLRSDSGFAADTNTVVLYDRFGTKQEISTRPKAQIARIVVDAAIGLISKNTH